MWRLDYDNGLTLEFSGCDIDSIIYSGFYKLSLRRYIKSVLPDHFIFKPSLTYLDYKKIIRLCEKEIERRREKIEVTAKLQKYIDTREMYIEIRSRLGIELKTHNDKLTERFQYYRSIIDCEMSRKLREQQAWDSFFMCAMRKSGNFSVPGSGKTASVLGMFAFLRSKGLLKKIIVICPKNAFGSWIDEFAVCFQNKIQLNVLNIHDSKFQNTAQRNTAIKYDSGNCNLILVNYESVGSVLDSLLEVIDEKTLLVFDEVHKVKRINGKYAENALVLSSKSQYTVAMTGTPIPNSYKDIYNFLHILFEQEYNEFFGFSVPLLNSPTPSDIVEINSKIQPFFCRTTKEQLGVPKSNKDYILNVKASSAENRLLHILKMKYRRNKLPLFIRTLQMESNPNLLLESLDLSEFDYLLDDSVEISEIDYANYSEEVKILIEQCNVTTKFKECIKLASTLVQQGKPLIIWCIFIDSIKRIETALNQRGILTKCVFGEIPLEERQQVINEFKIGHIQVLITNPHTLAESVSLHSVCHDAIYYEYSYNLVHLLQSKDRIHRLGLPKEQYTQYYYCQVTYETSDGQWSMNENVYNRLREKEQIMLNAIDRGVLEVMPTSEEDLDVIFSNL